MDCQETFSPKTPLPWRSSSLARPDSEEDENDSHSGSNESSSEDVDPTSESEDAVSVEDDQEDVEGGWSSLSEDVLFQICALLPVQDRLRAGLTCRSWNTACTSECVWKVADGREWARRRVMTVHLGAEEGNEVNSKTGDDDEWEHVDQFRMSHYVPVGDLYMRKVAELSQGALLHLQIAFCSFVGLAAVAMSCLDLRRLDMDHFFGEINSALLAIGGKCSQLQVLSINVNPSVGFEPSVVRSGSVLALAEGCPNLETLKFQGCRATHGQAEILANSLPELRNLQATLGGIWAPGAELKTISDVLLALSSNCPNLESVDLESSSKSTDGALLALLTRCTNMTEIHLSGERITGEGLHMCSNLQSLSLTSFYPTDMASCQLSHPLSPRFPHHFEAHGWAADTPSQMAAPGEANYTPANEKLSPVWQLQSLDLKLVKGDEPLLAFAAVCPKLTRLHLREADVSDAAIASLAQLCPMLTDVDISGIKGLTDQALVGLATGCRHLSVLDCRLDSSELRGFSLAAIECLVSSCPLLTEVKMNLPIIANQATGGSPRYFSALPTLQTLSQLGAQLQRLTLIGYKSFEFDDINPALAVLAHHCSNLTSLDLVYIENLVNWAIEAVASSLSAITRASFHGKDLDSRAVGILSTLCPELEHLDLSNTSIDQDDLDVFRIRWPRKQLLIST